MVATHMQWLDPQGVTYTVDFDAVEHESPEFGVQITEYPVEMGAPLIDFIRAEQVKLKLTTFISNAPVNTKLSHLDGRTFSETLPVKVRRPILDTPQGLQTGSRLVGANFLLPTSIAGLPLTREVEVQAQVRTWHPFKMRLQRVENVLAELKRAMYEAREFTVLSDLLGDFDRMLIKGLRTDRDSKSGNAIRLDIELAQVQYAELYTRDVRHLLPKKPKKKQSEPPKDLGVQGTKEVDPTTLRSAAKQIGQPSDPFYGVVQ